MTTKSDKQFIACKLPSATVKALEAYAEQHNISRSKAMRKAFAELLNSDPDGEFVEA